MMKRKIRLGALLAVSVMMLALLIGGLYGAFDDTETSIGNTFTAGSLNLISVIDGNAGAVGDNFTINEGAGVDNADGINDNVTFGEVYPGASGNITWTLSNIGTLDGELTLDVAVYGDENTCTEPELAAFDTDDADGELISKLTCDVFIDGTQAYNDIALAMLQTNLDGYIAPLGAGDSTEIRVEWSADSGAFDNTVQTDTAQIDITFVLTQV